ncbi:single-stranded DNA binding protein [Harp seal herpesvirus]|uniref:Single-stranded DNA binding protein n=1 Tax=phocid gammaherpesvirus 3 TaxID=2560643 RepID=A0A0R5X8L3_9GAMA|nr:single-stranded DNA binding protein [Harp seal herpesvirus]AJG42935.1 single-stranded DNA binding protein [Harp seal herpesvirus]
MNNKGAAGPNESNLGTNAPLGPCGYIYVYNQENFPYAEASVLGNLHAGGEVFSLPLLYGLTVEHDFLVNVKAVHKKIDQATVSTRACTFHREVIFFHGVNCFQPIFQGPGLQKLCDETRALFGFSTFKPEPLSENLFKLSDLEPLIPDVNNSACAVVVTESFKERLYYGKLVPISSQIQRVQVGACEAYKVPLYDVDLFSKCPSEKNLKVFYSATVSKYLYEALYTGLAQALRVKDVSALIAALEKQSIHDQYKLPKIYSCREFPLTSLKGLDASSLMVIDSVASELAASYGLSFTEVPQESTSLLHYDKWPIFEGCATTEERMAALETWNAKQAIHVHTQLFATNSILYLARISKQANVGKKAEDTSFNTYFLQHGLGFLSESTQKENGIPSFEGVPSSLLSGSNYTLQHLVYAASFSPSLLARVCFYLQFCQHHKSSANPSYNITQYVGSAANSDMCDLCGGHCPASCINTLFYRLKDRFPPVTSSHRRDPYVISGVAGEYNDLDFAGNFASFREKDEDGTKKDEDVQKYTYWQLSQTIMERLSEMGVSADSDAGGTITSVSSFLQVFKEIDAVVDTEVVKFINSMVKNNINYRETVKGIHHVIQYVCNVYWQPPCSVFLMLYYKSILSMIQDICLPACMIYEQENSAAGQTPGEWLKMHYQTLWTNFKGTCFDKGVLTGSEYKVVHNEPFSDFFDTEAALRGSFASSKVQIRVSRPLFPVPKMIKIKNRILFSNSSGSEAIQSAFVKSNMKSSNYILSGPYMKFLNTYHRVMFPNAKISALFMWDGFTKKRQLPVLPGSSKEEVIELANYIDYNSKMHDEFSVIDVTPDNLTAYAKTRLNNAIFRACGQSQFFVTTLHCLTPMVQAVGAEEYPHVLGEAALEDSEDYLNKVQGKNVKTIQSYSRENICAVGRNRPIITVPLVVNKYSGITGNSQIFHCGNLGYFLGRGVDKNLIPDSSFRKQNNNMSYMRKRHVFMTPMTDHIVKSFSGAGTAAFEIETVKKKVQSIFSDPSSPDVVNRVVIQLVASLGPACKNLTSYDLEYYLGKYYIIAEEISTKLQMLVDIDGLWTEEWAKSLLEDDHNTNFEEYLEFVSLDEPMSFAPPVDEFNQSTTSLTIGSAKKRKLNAMIGELDL